jgi:ORF6N domain
MKPRSKTSSPPVSLELIERRIYLIRGQKVMLDADLAELYQAPTFRLNEAVKRNPGRFPEDFMFQLTKEELGNWRSQIAISNPGAKMGLRRPPYAFTELGVAMLSSVLNSDRAVKMNIAIMRAFVRLREVLSSHKALAEKIEKIEHTQKQHGSVLVAVVQDIQRIKNPPVTRAIGFMIRSPKKK